MEWKFNPPSSQMMGGVLESLKQSLKSVTNHQTFTEEAY